MVKGPQNQDAMQPQTDTPPRSPHWNAFLKTQEGLIFLLGLGCLLGILVWVVVCTDTDAGKAATILAIVPAHVTGGRAAGLAIATRSGQFSVWEAILLASLIEAMVVCLFFSVFCLSLKTLVTVPWLQTMMRNVRSSAEEHRPRLAKWGIFGLLLFVWFPLMMTGPVVGSVLGYLLGLRAWATLLTVLAGTIAAIISWAFLMDWVDGLTEKAGALAPTLAVAVLVAGIVAVRLRSYRQALRAPTAPPSPAAAPAPPPPAAVANESPASPR